MSLCIVSGTLETADGVAAGDVPLYFSASVPQPLASANALLVRDAIAIVTNPDGTFSVGLARTSIVRVQCARTKLDVTVQVPDTPTANLSDMVAVALSAPPLPGSAYATIVQVTDEAARAAAAEAALALQLTNETTRAEAAESATAASISAETSRAAAAEGALATSITAITAKTTRLVVVDSTTLETVQSDGVTPGTHKIAALDMGNSVIFREYDWQINPLFKGYRVDIPFGPYSAAWLVIDNGVWYAWDPVNNASGAIKADTIATGTENFKATNTSVSIHPLVLPAAAPAHGDGGVEGEIRFDSGNVYRYTGGAWYSAPLTFTLV